MGEDQGSQRYVTRLTYSALTLVGNLMSWRLLAAVLSLNVVTWAGTIPAGTDLVVRLEYSVETAKKGKYPETFEAWLAKPVIVDGREMLPTGTVVKGEVRGDKKHVLLIPKQLNLPDGRRLPFNASVRALDRVDLELEETEGTIAKRSNKPDTIRETAKGAETGAAEAYGTTGRAIDMAIGAGVGAGAVLVGKKITGRNNGPIIPTGTQLTLTLNRPLEVPDNAARKN